MDSSSEGSFAWTDASDDSTDNDDMAKSKLSITQSGEESESGLGYKKKLQQQLFSGRGEAGEEPPAARGKRKLAPEPAQPAPPRKKIKLEPDSDAERAHNKGKPALSTHHSSSEEQYDDDFLDQKVKSEQSFAVPSAIKSKKNKKKSVSGEDRNSTDIEVNASTCSGTNGFLERSDSYVAESSSILDPDEIEHDSKSKKKKKKKKSRHRSPTSSETGDREETLSAAEIDSQLEPQPRASAEDGPPRTPPAQLTELTNGDRSAAPADISFDKRKSRISERIRFEDDEDTDVPTKDLDASVKSAQGGDSKLKSYLGNHGYLRRLAPCPAPPRAHDDVWVVRAPRDVPLDAFLGARWALGARSKLKLAGHSYEAGAVEAAPRVLALAGARSSSLRRVQPAADLRLRRRLPEARAADEAPPARRAFIPLPDTKCRHPLLGAHYKKALRLPEAAAARLRRRPAPAQSDPEPEPKKKKKKRKRSERAAEDQHAWDSEKAIEQNLFNF